MKYIFTNAVNLFHCILLPLSNQKSLVCKMETKKCLAKVPKFLLRTLFSFSKIVAVEGGEKNAS